MIRTTGLGLTIALCLQAGSAFADFAAGEAAYNLGSYRIAWDEWSAAAWDNDTRAQRGLARLLEHGFGITQDTYAAYVWYQIADFDPYIDLTPKLTELAAHLTPAELEQAEQEAYAQSIEILSRRVVPVFAPSPPAAAPYGYTWFQCDCAHVDGPVGDYPSFDAGIGSKFTF